MTSPPVPPAPSSVPGRRPRRALAVGRHILLAGLLTLPTPREAAAQFGIVDALARRFSDVSFFANRGALHGASGGVTGPSLVNYGIEVFLEIGGTHGPAPTAPPRGDTVSLVWTGMQVVRRGSGADTTQTYEVRPPPPRPRGDPVWVFEIGVGYGQLTGFGLEDAELDLRGAVRDLPSLSLYAVYEPWDGYFGIRSGFMKTAGLQVFDAEGASFAGEAEGFLAGLAVGRFVEVLDLSLFVEGAYTWRDFPSIQWRGAGPLPANAPRSMGLHGWTVGAGIQFGVGGD